MTQSRFGLLVLLVCLGASARAGAQGAPSEAAAPGEAISPLEAAGSADPDVGTEPPSSPDAEVPSAEAVAPAEVVAAPAPVPAPPAAEAPHDDVQITVAPGRGLTVTSGDTFSLQLRARMQVRDTLHVPNSADASRNTPSNELQIRTIRVWLLGNVLDRNTRYGIQLALGPSDFEPNNASPLFDAYLESTHLRDLSFRVGQFFVAFDRARTIREFALQTVDRAGVVRELSLDRDIGVMLFSNDLFGWEGRLAYALGFFAGDGRNRLATTAAPGFLFVGRMTVRPMGPFDDDQEGDLTHSASPHLAIGFGIAYNQSTDRPRSTTSVSSSYQFYQLGGYDYFHMAADLVFKWAGFSFLGEWLWRTTNGVTERTGMPAGATMPITEYSRQAWGLEAQAGMMLGDLVALYARYEQMEAIGATDPTLIATVQSAGRATAGGVNVYVNGHSFKLQLDWQHTFGSDYTIGEHLFRLQLDATF